MELAFVGSGVKHAAYEIGKVKRRQAFSGGGGLFHNASGTSFLHFNAFG